MVSQVTTTIYVARHGQTDYNAAGGRIQGGESDRAENQLNQTGREQAHQLGKMMASVFPGISAFYSSGLGRANETSRIVKTYFPKVKESVHANSNFDEMRHGPHEAMITRLWDEYAKEFFAIQKARTSSPDPKIKWTQTPFTGEETNQQLFDRLYKGMMQVAAENPEKEAFVCSHGAAINTLRIWCTTNTNEELKHYTEIPAIKNCAVAVFACCPQAEQARDRLKLLKIVDS